LAGVLLTIVMVVATPVVWRRRGAIWGMRWLAVALVPAGLAMAGLLTLFGRIGNAIAAFVSRFVFSPTVWVGYALLALSVVLWLTARTMQGRRAGAPKTSPAVGSAPAQIASGKQAGKKPATASVDDEFADIEAILHRRGIN
jgi:hypothetical protein